MCIGTVITADAEAKDITSFVASTHSRARPEADQDVAHTEQLLQLPHERTLTKLSMQGGEGFVFWPVGHRTRL
jgi:hypothetical protein